VGPIMEVAAHPHKAKSIPLRVDRVEMVLGISFGIEELERILLSLGFGIEDSEKERIVLASVPSFRSYDITREIDLIEEIARVYGYDRFPDDFGAYLPSSVPDDPLFHLEEDIRNILVTAGIREAINPAFTNVAEGEVEILNPISSEESYLRKSLIPGLLKNLEYNLARSTRDIRLFEIGTVFLGTGEMTNDSVTENTNLASLITGGITPPHWSQGTIDKVGFWTLKGIVTKVVRACGWNSVTFNSTDTHSGKWINNRLVEVASDGSTIGFLGQVSPDHFEAPKWVGEVWALELSLPEKAPENQVIQFQPLPQYPSVDRDLACLLKEEISADDVVAKIKEVGGLLLQEVSIFDVYTGSGTPRDRRSLGVRMRYQSLERTLTDVEVDHSVDKIIKSLQEDLNVHQRM